MKLSDFDYQLPPELIAQTPTKPRDHSRLLILNRQNGQTEHKRFYSIIDYLEAGDVLILNNSKVIPARLIGQKETGGEIEIFLAKKELNENAEIWECLIKGRAKRGLLVGFANDLSAELLSSKEQTWLVKFNKEGKDFMQAIEEIGQVPLPPYIKKALTTDDQQDYQTVYADDQQRGSVAAPTAGFHFTEKLLQQLQDKGIKIEYLTLHIGLGTFLPVKTEQIEDHQMHAEWVEIKKETMQTIQTAKSQQKKIVAVGTTSCRSLEAVWQNNDLDHDFSAWVDIFIYPGYQFKIIDALLTNFHLPKSTLLMLVSAFAGKEHIDQAYQEAIQKKYRFYSYGDAMLII